MSAPNLTYGLEDRPPLGRLLLYSLQWTLLTLPLLSISANLVGQFLNLDPVARVAAGQKFMLLTGVVMLLQGLLGHAYPLIDGPAGALLLCFASLAPLGPENVAGALVLGGAALGLLAWLGRLDHLERIITDNISGTVVMLLAFVLMPLMLPLALGTDSGHPAGDPGTAGLSLMVIFLIPVLSHWLPGFPRTLSVLLGLLAGTLAFALLGRVDLSAMSNTPWLTLPQVWPLVWPRLSPAGAMVGLLANLIVLVNLVGSLAAIRAVVGGGDFPARIRRGSTLTGLAGVTAGLLGVYGSVPYAYSPGVILTTGVGTRWATVLAGAMILGLSFCQKLAALLTAVPLPVVAAALIAGLSGQIGAGLSVLTRGGRVLSGRDYFVVGLPLLLATLAATLGRDFLALLPPLAGMLLGNGLVVGMVSLLLLEHGLLRRKKE